MKFTKALTIIGTAAILLTSCSQQRYAHRSKVRVDENHQTAVRKHKQEAIQEVQSPVYDRQLQEPKHDAVQALPVAPADLNQVTKSSTQEAAPSAVKQLNAQQKRAIKAPVEKLEKIQKQGEEQGSPFASKWFKLMIIGILIALVGLVLGVIGLGPIGGIVNAIGGLIFLIGLILWIVELVA